MSEEKSTISQVFLDTILTTTRQMNFLIRAERQGLPWEIIHDFPTFLKTQYEQEPQYHI